MFFFPAFRTFFAAFRTTAKELDLQAHVLAANSQFSVILQTRRANSVIAGEADWRFEAAILAASAVRSPALRVRLRSNRPRPPWL